MELEQELVELGRVRAPNALYPRAMAAVGLADSYGRLETGLGLAFVAWNKDGVVAVRLGSDEAEFERWFEDEYGRPALKASALPRDLGRRFDLHRLPPFQQAVLKKALEIPSGQVRPYAWIAREI